MKNRIIALSFCIALMSGGLGAQNFPPQEIRLVEIDTTEGRSHPQKMIAASDGGFFIAGYQGATDHQRAYLAKLNPAGRMLWRQDYQFGEAAELGSLIELPSGEIVAAGSCRNCVPGDTVRKALVVKLDAKGEVMADTTFGEANLNAYGTDLILNAGGKLAIVGTFVDTAYLQRSSAFLAILDDQLQLQHWNAYKIENYNAPLAVAQAADGGYVLAGWVAYIPIWGATYPLLIGTDAQGLRRWHYVANLPSNYRAVQMAPDGRIVALADYPVSAYGTRLVLGVHDPDDGILLAEKALGGSADDRGFSLQAIEGGFLIGAKRAEPSEPGNNARDWVCLIDEDLEIVEHYFDESAHGRTLVNAVPLSDDGVDFAYLSRLTIFGVASDLFYKRTRLGRHSHLTEAPQHYQLLPRDLATNQGRCVYAGSLPDPLVYDEMRLQVYRNDTLIQAFQDFEPADFSFELPVPAELAQYRFRLSGIKDGQETLEAEAIEVVAGDVFIIQGQSNARAVRLNVSAAQDSAYLALEPYNHYVRAFGNRRAGEPGQRWHNEADRFRPVFLDDNRSGDWGMVLAKRIAAAQGIPVAILNGGIGGIAIDDMLPNPAAPHSAAHSYGRFYQRVEAAGLREHIRAILFFQGETNALPGYNETVDSYQDKYLQLRSHWQADFEYEREYLFQIRPGCWAGNFHLIQEAQRQLALEIPSMEIMSATGMNHDGCHYHYPNGYERAGKDIYRLLAHQIYGAPLLPNAHPPAVDSAWFSSCDHREITLRFRQEGDTYLWHPGWEQDFRLEGVPGAAVLSGAIAGHTLKLALSDSISAPAFSGLSYVSHVGGDEAPVKNANGIGMLAFYDFPVAPFYAPNLEIQLDGNTLIALEADAEYQWIDCDAETAIPGETAQSFTPSQSGSYAVVLRRDGCEKRSACVAVTIVGTSAVGVISPQARLFPNPATEYVDLQIPGNASATLELYDLQGRLLLARQIQGDERVSLAGLSPGMYFYSLTASSWQQNGKLVKQ